MRALWTIIKIGQIFSQRIAVYIRSKVSLGILRASGASVGSGLTVKRGVRFNIERNSKILIGKNVTFDETSSIHVGQSAELILEDSVYIGRGSVIATNGKIKIGSGSQIAHYVTVIDSNHEYRDFKKPLLQQGKTVNPICIGSEVWIGANAVILPGCKIGNHCVVGAGAVVTRSFSEHEVIVGNPAKILSRPHTNQPAPILSG